MEKSKVKKIVIIVAIIAAAVVAYLQLVDRGKEEVVDPVVPAVVEEAPAVVE
ncbi:hypothetical protein LCGC14_3050760 [marine sediment metagenome]|uniref:Uncharacterized protein n=1 Tax=marine sediment metagenome TaxID=412755 RepID=A0A0F8WLP7_9ZZZZ